MTATATTQQAPAFSASADNGAEVVQGWYREMLEAHFALAPRPATEQPLRCDFPHADGSLSTCPEPLAAVVVEVKPDGTLAAPYTCCERHLAEIEAEARASLPRGFRLERGTDAQGRMWWTAYRPDGCTAAETTFGPQEAARRAIRDA